MIDSKESYIFYLNADKLALRIPEESYIGKIKRFIFPNHIWDFQKALRRAEYYKNCQKNIFDKIKFIIAYKRYRTLSLKLGFTIPLNAFGPGLSIAHYGTIIVHYAVKIGANCRIHACVNIGASGGNPKAPIIGDNCYIGPGAKIYGDITIANNTAISANAAVGKSFLNENKIIGGIPAKEISESKIEKLLVFADKGTKKGIILTDELSAEAINKKILEK